MEIPPVGRAREILARADRCVSRRRADEVEDLLLLLCWADSHAGDPQREPDPVPTRRGGPRLVRVGGEGTPQVVDLCFAEMAIARQASEVSTRNVTADALDLRHRLPQVWAHLRQFRCETWVARKIARMSRPLSPESVAVVDAAVAEAIDQSPSRLLAIAEAKVVEADQEAHLARVRRSRARRGVWFPKPAPGAVLDEGEGAAGVRTVFGRLAEADAFELEQAVEDLAAVLADRGDYADEEVPTWDQLRADSLGLLARPGDALALLTGQESLDKADAPEGPDEACAPVAREHHRPQRRRARLIAHLSDATLVGLAGGVVRVEDIGPMLVEQLAELLGHRDIEVLPVVDLREARAVNGYEHPGDVRTRTELRMVGEVFPHSGARPGARVDHDHPAPYDSNGPPGQTGDHNDAPLARRHHRAKTHLGYRLVQLAPGAYRWVTPHGLGRVVTPRGTQKVALLRTPDGRVFGELYPSRPAEPAG